MLVLVSCCALLCALGLWVWELFGVGPAQRWIRELRPDRSAFARREAAMRLGRVTSWQSREAIPALVAALKDPDPNVRSMALASRAFLTRRHDLPTTAVLPHIVGLLHDPVPNVRVATTFALETMLVPGSPEAQTVVPVLIDLLEDESPDVRLEACRALFVFGHGPRTVPALIRLVREEQGSPRLGALGFLLRLGRLPVALEPTLRAMLESETSGERLWAARGLLQLGRTEMALPTLRRSLEGHQVDEQLIAAGLMIQYGQEAAAMPVVRTATRSQHMSVRRKAEVLLAILPPEMEPALREMLASEHVRERLAAAAELLNRDQVDDALPVLREAARDEDITVREEAEGLLNAAMTTSDDDTN